MLTLSVPQNVTAAIIARRPQQSAADVLCRAQKKRLNSGTSPQRRIKLVQTADFKRVACKYGGSSQKAYFRLAFLYARHRRQSCDTAIKINPPSDGRSPLEKAAFIAVEVKNRTKRHQQPQSVYMSAENCAESRTDPFY